MATPAVRLINQSINQSHPMVTQDLLALGGSLKAVTTGSAPSDRKLLEFYEHELNLPIYDGSAWKFCGILEGQIPESLT